MDRISKMIFETYGAHGPVRDPLDKLLDELRYGSADLRDQAIEAARAAWTASSSRPTATRAALVD